MLQVFRQVTARHGVLLSLLDQAVQHRRISHLPNTLHSHQVILPCHRHMSQARLEHRRALSTVPATPQQAQLTLQPHQDIHPPVLGTAQLHHRIHPLAHHILQQAPATALRHLLILLQVLATAPPRLRIPPRAPATVRLLQVIPQLLQVTVRPHPAIRQLLHLIHPLVQATVPLHHLIRQRARPTPQQAPVTVPLLRAIPQPVRHTLQRVRVTVLRHHPIHPRVLRILLQAPVIHRHLPSILHRHLRTVPHRPATHRPVQNTLLPAHLTVLLLRSTVHPVLNIPHRVHHIHRLLHLTPHRVPRILPPPPPTVRHHQTILLLVRNLLHPVPLIHQPVRPILQQVQSILHHRRTILLPAQNPDRRVLPITHQLDILQRVLIILRPVLLMLLRAQAIHLRMPAILLRVRNTPLQAPHIPPAITIFLLRVPLIAQAVLAIAQLIRLLVLMGIVTLLPVLVTVLHLLGIRRVHQVVVLIPPMMKMRIKSLNWEWFSDTQSSMFGGVNSE